MKNDTYEDLKEEIQSLFMIESLEKTNIKMYFVGKTLKFIIYNIYLINIIILYFRIKHFKIRRMVGSLI